MARHSHFANIKRWKAVTDAVRGKAFTMHARLVAIAARAGGDPSMNPGLRSAIDRAKEANVPNANIERAIRKGTGEDKEGAVFEEATYEAFGPEGCVMMIDAVTDNTNRTLGNLRLITSKNGGNLGGAGSVAWKFDRKACLLVDAGGKPADEVELTLIDCGADDLTDSEGRYEVYSSPEKLYELKKNIEAAGFIVEKSELIWRPKEEMLVSDKALADRIFALTDKIDEDEDVVRVTTNVSFDSALDGQV